MSDPRTAYHESGHAVVASSLNKRFSRVSILADGEIMGRVIFPSSYIVKLEEKKRPGNGSKLTLLFLWLVR